MYITCYFCKKVEAHLTKRLTVSFLSEGFMGDLYILYLAYLYFLIFYINICGF